MNKLVFVHMETKHTWGWGALHSGEGLYTLCALVERKITMLKLKYQKLILLVHLPNRRTADCPFGPVKREKKAEEFFSFHSTSRLARLPLC